jgi:hypothetical protein
MLNFWCCTRVHVSITMDAFSVAATNASRPKHGGKNDQGGASSQYRHIFIHKLCTRDTHQLPKLKYPRLNLMLILVFDSLAIHH